MRVSRGFVLGVLTAAFVAGPAPFAQAKTLHVTDVSTDISIRPDGSFVVRETRMFAFSGAFHAAQLTVPADSGFGITGVGVAEGARAYKPGRRDSETPGTFSFVKSSGTFEITWFFSATNVRKTFTISYVVSRAIKAYPDVAEFRWFFIGSGWDVPTAHAKAIVHLPAGATKGRLHAWGHPPPAVVASVVDAQTVSWETTDLPAYTAMEGRLIFPPNLVPGVARERGDRTGQVIDEEAKIPGTPAESLVIPGWYNTWAPILAGISFALFGLLWIAFGRDPRVRVTGTVNQPPSNDPPALVGFLMRGGTVRPEDVVATILDLARRGYLRILAETVEKGVARKRAEQRPGIEVLKREGSDLQPHEKVLLQFLEAAVADGADQVDELHAWAGKNPDKISSVLMGFRWSLRSEAKHGGLIRTHPLVALLNVLSAIAASAVVLIALGYSGGPASKALLSIGWAGMLALRHRKLKEAVPIAISVAGLLIGGSALSVTLRHAPGAMVGMVLVAVQVGLGSLLRQPTQLGAERRAAWEAFRRFLAGLPEAAEKPPPGEAWERYLVYSLPLGAADEVTQTLASDASIAGGGFDWIDASTDGKKNTEALAAFFGALNSDFVAPAAAAFVKPEKRR